METDNDSTIVAGGLLSDIAKQNGKDTGFAQDIGERMGFLLDDVTKLLIDMALMIMFCICIILIVFLLSRLFLRVCARTVAVVVDYATDDTGAYNRKQVHLKKLKAVRKRNQEFEQNNCDSENDSDNDENDDDDGGGDDDDDDDDDYECENNDDGNRGYDLGSPSQSDMYSTSGSQGNRPWRHTQSDSGRTSPASVMNAHPQLPPGSTSRHGAPEQRAGINASALQAAILNKNPKIRRNPSLNSVAFGTAAHDANSGSNNNQSGGYMANPQGDAASKMNSIRGMGISTGSLFADGASRHNRP